MSQENVKLVRGLQPGPDIDMAAMFRDDAVASAMFEAIGPLFHPGFECVTVASIQGERRYPGLDGLQTAWLDWLEPWESYRTEIEDVLGVGDDVIVLVRDYGRRYGMEAETAVEGASIWTVRAGKVARVAFYLDRAEALEAVGLSE